MIAAIILAVVVVLGIWGVVCFAIIKSGKEREEAISKMICGEVGEEEINDESNK